MAMESKFENNLPDRLVFQFNNVTLQKEYGLSLIFVYPQWSDAQRGPPPDWDMTPKLNVCKTDDLGEIWKKLTKLDFQKYANLKDSDFEQTPPDMSHCEILNISWEGSQIVSWAKSYMILKPELAAPLREIYSMLHEKNK
jgi:hypothetical protein